jgi:hypothetical protein
MRLRRSVLGYGLFSATNWWLRSPFSTNTYNAFIVYTNGYYNYTGCSSVNGVRPALVLPSSLLVSDTGEVVTNQAPTAPPSITVPGSVISTQQISVSWAASTDPDGNAITYILERQYNGGSWAQVASTSGRTFSEAVPATWNSIRYRVKAQDSLGLASAYTTSSIVTVIHNQPPVISGQDGDLGVQTSDFGYKYSVSDVDGDVVTVTESVDGVPLRSYTVVLGAENEAEIVGTSFLVLAPGEHTLVIVATDTQSNTATRTMTFTRQITGLTIGLKQPLPAAAQPRRATIGVTRQIPAGATFKAETTNNPYDAAPVWEDCTRAVLSNLAYVFDNAINVSPQYGMSIRVSVVRGAAIGECWVSGITGNFE